DQLADGGGPVADDAGRAADGGGDELLVDDDQAQILALEVALEDDLVRDPARALDGGLDLVPRGEADRDALALLAAHGLDDDAAMFRQEGRARLRIAARHLGGDAHAGGLDDAPRDALVVADRHGDGGGELRERLATAHRAAAMGQAEEAALGV